MKKNVSVIIVLMLILIMTGCTTDLKVDENAVENISNKVTEKVIETLGKEKAEKTESSNINAADLNGLVIKSSVGDVNISTHDSNEAIIDVTVKASSNSKENAEKLLKETKYTIDTKWNNLNIDTSELNSILDDSENISINLTIKLPKNINKISLKSSVGNLNIENFDGKIEALVNVGDIIIKNSSSSYDVTTDVGDIKLYDSSLNEKSKFNVNTGNIEITSADISNAKDLTAFVQVGDINISVPENSSYEVTISSFMQNKKVETKGGGNTKITLTNKVGDVNFK